MMSRGNHQDAIFKDDRDCEIFLDTLGEACAKTGWLVHAFVLMGNHYHLLLETPAANLVEGMKWLQGTYTQRFNSRHKVRGHLLQGRYKALVVDGSESGYFTAVSNYIHLNPARAGLFDLQNGKLTDYPWSSYPGYIRPSKRPEWLCVGRTLGNLNCADDLRGLRMYAQIMRKRIVAIAHCDNPHEADIEWPAIRKGWCFGAEGFQEELMSHVQKAASRVRKDSLGGGALRSYDTQAAEKLCRLMLKDLNVQEDDLQSLPKGAYEKKLLAWGLRTFTTVSREWVALRLKMGHVTRVTQSVVEVNRSTECRDKKLQLQKIVKLLD